MELRRAASYSGEVYACDRGHVYRKNKNGNITRMNVTVRKDGYVIVGLHRDGVRAARYVHRVVAEAWLGPPPPGAQVRHLNHDPADNSPENLLYGSAKDNSLDSVRSGRFPRGDTHHCATLTTANINSIKDALAMGVARKVIAAHFRVSKQTISALATGRNFRAAPPPAA